MFRFAAAAAALAYAGFWVDDGHAAVTRGPSAPPLLRIELAELSHRQGQRTTAAEHLDADCFERCRGYRGRNLLHHLAEIFHKQILQQKRADGCGPSSI